MNVRRFCSFFHFLAVVHVLIRIVEIDGFHLSRSFGREQHQTINRIKSTRKTTTALWDSSLSDIADDQLFIWALRGTSAVVSYFGFLLFFDPPRGQLLENADQYLQVQQSTVEGAGLGLFAKVSLPQGTVLGTYPGVVIPLQQNLNKLKEYPECEGYVWRFSDNQFVIDPTNEVGILDSTCRGGNPSMPLSQALFQLLNAKDQGGVPTMLCRINEPPLGRDVNVVTDEDRDRRQVTFSLERDVYAGEEFFIDYGLSYDRSMYGGGGGSSSTSDP